MYNKDYIAWLIIEIHNTERYSVENKMLWRNLYSSARQHARHLQRDTADTVFERDTDDTMVQIIVDQWLADNESSYQAHSNPKDDRLAGDMSCVQAMEHQAKQDAIETIRDLFGRPLRCQRHQRLAIRERIYDQVAGSSPRLAEFFRHASDQWLADNATEVVDKAIKYTSCDITAYTNFGETHERNNLSFLEHESLESADQEAIQREYDESFYQSPECDPDDARFLGTPPKSDDWEDKMKSDYQDRGRGATGVLGGLYTESLPEPSYRTAAKKRTLRKTLFNSEREADALLGVYVQVGSNADSRNRLKQRIKQKFNTK
jgi:hypothetical protein